MLLAAKNFGWTLNKQKSKTVAFFHQSTVYQNMSWHLLLGDNSKADTNKCSSNFMSLIFSFRVAHCMTDSSAVIQFFRYSTIHQLYHQQY